MVFATGGKIIRQELSGNGRRELPVRLSVPRVAEPPLLVTHARVLDVAEAISPRLAKVAM